MAMTPDELRSVCLAPPAAVEVFPFPRYPDRSVFKVGGKVFALSSLRREPLLIGLKCDPDIAVELRRRYPAIEAGYRLNKRHWNTVTIDGTLPDGFVQTMVEDSYDLVAGALTARERRSAGLP